MPVLKAVLYAGDNGFSDPVIVSTVAQQHLQVQYPVVIQAGLQHAAWGYAHLVARCTEVS